MEDIHQFSVFLCFCAWEECERIDFREAGKGWDNRLIILQGTAEFLSYTYCQSDACIHTEIISVKGQCDSVWKSLGSLCFRVSVLSYTIHPTTDRLCTTSCDRYTLRSDLFKSLKILLDYTHYLKGCLSLQKFLIFSEGPLAVR